MLVLLLVLELVEELAKKEREKNSSKVKGKKIFCCTFGVGRG